MSARDDLAELIGDTWNAMPSPADHVWHILADEILAAGFRAPARKIDTVEELDALPYGTVIRDSDGDVCEAIGCGGSRGMRWIETGWSDERGSAALSTATVLWEPGDDDE